MPSNVTHYIFAEEIKKDVASLVPGIRLSEAAFFYGTHGPDILFSYRAWRMAWGGRTLRETGSLLHHVSPSKMFALMKEYAEKEPCDRELVLSYIYGFICHYALDRNTHPLIYAVQKEFTSALHRENELSFIVHNQIESNIDIILLKTRLGYSKPQFFNISDTFDPNPYVIDEIASLLAYVVPQVIISDTDKKDFIYALRDIRTGQVALHDSTGLKRKVISVIEKPFFKLTQGPLVSGLIRKHECDCLWDYMNDSHRQWTLPFDSRVKSTESFSELYNKAKADALRLISAFNGDDPQTAIREICGDMSFDTGVHYSIKEPQG